MQRALPALTIALALGGCVNLNDFNPVGGVATISGGWTIDGSTPTSLSCGKLGAAQVQVTFLDRRRPVPHSGLFFSCTATQPDTDVTGRFDTRRDRGGSGAVVAGGPPDAPDSWDIRIDAVDGAGNIIAAGAVNHVMVAENVDPDADPPHIELPDAMFYTPTVTAFFDIAGQVADASRCEDLGVDQVRLVFEGAPELDTIEACAAGAVGTRVPPDARYVAHLEALDPLGTLVGTSESQSIVVASGNRCVLGAGCAAALPSSPPTFDLSSL